MDNTINMDNTIEDLKSFHNYKYINEIVLTQELIDKFTEITDMLHSLPNEINLNRIFKFKIKKESIKFMTELFHMHKIGYFPDDRIDNFFRNNMDKNKDQLIEEYNKSASMISPFDLPIKYTGDNINYGRLIPQLISSNDPKTMCYIFKRIKIFYKNIELSKTITEASPVIYIHEITHSQIDSHKGLIEDMANRETLPIFLELLYAYNNEELFNYTLFRRMDHVIKSFYMLFAYQIDHNDVNMSIKEYCENMAYVTGTLEAFHMLNKYLKGSENEKRYILIWIQEVFNGKITFEECLEKIGVSFANSANTEYVRNLIKENN